MVVTQDIVGIRQAALDLMEESLRAEDVQRVLDNLGLQNASDSTIAKALPVRKLPAAYYDFATYLMWMRGVIDSNVNISVMADEADGLRAIQSARYEFERNHPACPRCDARQYSSTPMMCRKCGLDFKKGR